MDRPYIVIHTHTSIDGNLDIMDLPPIANGDPAAHRFFAAKGTVHKARIR